MNRVVGVCWWAVRALLWLGFATLLLLALYVSLGRELVPLVSAYQDQFELKASEALGSPVRIGRLEGRWEGLSPVFVAYDVQVGDEPESPNFERVQVTPGILDSLRTRSLRIAHVQIDGVLLALIEAPDGQWRLDGLPLRGDATAPDIEQIIRQSQMIEQISLFDSRLVLELQGQAPIALHSININLRNGLRSQRLQARFALPDGQPVALNLRTRVDPAKWRQATSQFYLSLPQSDWAQWLPARLTGQWHIDQLHAGAELWLRSTGLQIDDATLKLHAAQAKARYGARKALQLQDIAMQINAQQTQFGLQAQVSSLAFTQEEHRVSATQMRAQQDAAGNWDIRADRLDLAVWAAVVQAWAPLPDKAVEVLHTLAPQGALNQANVQWRPQAEGDARLSFASYLENVGFAAYHGAPAAQNVSGSVSGNLRSGELRLNSRDFALHLDHLFPEPWRYRQAQATLAWRVDDEAISLISPYVRLDGEEGQIAGDFLIRLRFAADQEDYMDLRVGLRDGDGRYTAKYLPTRLPAMSQALSHWLTTSIEQARVKEGYFQFQGSLGKTQDKATREMLMRFVVDDATLQLQPGWPALTHADGVVTVDDHEVRIEVPQAQMLASDVRAANGHIDLKTGGTPRLKVDAKVKSSLPDALAVLQQAPIGTEQIFAGWSGSGALDGRLQLDIGLQKGARSDAVVDFSVRGAELGLTEPNLSLSDIHGDFSYDTRRGLSAPEVSAQVFGKPLQGRIEAQGSPGQPSTRLHLLGHVAVADLLAWLQAPAPLPVSGELPYRVRLTLQGPDSQLRVDSNLQGVAIDLPAPFGKTSQQTRYADWRMTLSGAERRYWADYQDLASLSFAAAPGGFEQGRGELALAAGPARLPTRSGFWVRGNLHELDVEQWRAVWARYERALGGNAAPPGLFKRADLNIEQFSGMGQTVAGMRLSLEREPSAWALEIDSPLARGRVTRADDATAPLDIRLKSLRLPASDPGSEQDRPDPLADMDPRSVPAANVQIDQVQRGDTVLGSWSGQTRVLADGVALNKLNLNLAGLTITGDAQWRGPVGATRTHFKGRLSAGDLGKVLEAWDFAPSVTSERFGADADGNWPGSPAWFGLKRYSGDLDASLRSGQFVEVQGSAQALRVFGLLNFNSIGRRLRLDFSDLLGKGLAYDRVKAYLRATDGVYRTHEPLTLTGPSSNLELNGKLDMRSEEIEAKLLVTLPVTNNLPIAALLVGAPAIGGALFVVDKLLGDKVARFASVQYDVKGPMKDPEVSFDKPFEKPR